MFTKLSDLFFTNTWQSCLATFNIEFKYSYVKLMLVCMQFSRLGIKVWDSASNTEAEQVMDLNGVSYPLAYNVFFDYVRLLTSGGFLCNSRWTLKQNLSPEGECNALCCHLTDFCLKLKFQEKLLCP